MNELLPRVPVEVTPIAFTSEPEPLEEPAVVVQEASEVVDEEKPTKTEAIEVEIPLTSSETMAEPVVMVAEKPSGGVEVTGGGGQPPASATTPASTAAAVTSVTSEVTEVA